KTKARFSPPDEIGAGVGFETTGAGAAFGGASATGTGIGTGGGVGRALDTLTEKNLSNTEKLLGLDLERQEIQDNIASGYTDEVEGEGQLFANTQKRVALQKQIDEEQDKYNVKVAEARQAAEDETTAIEQQNAVMQLTLSGHGDLAEAL